MKKNNKGFTLAELLIVVAIIAVLVAISVPIFTTQLEKSREAVDIANIRAAYAEVVSDYLSNGQEEATATVTSVQTKKAWQNEENAELATRIDGVEGTVTVPATTKNEAGEVWTVTCERDESTGNAKITITIGT